MSTESSQEPPTATVDCPTCDDGRLDPRLAIAGFTTCPRCGHRAAAAFVAEALWLEHSIVTATTRLAWVRDRITAGDVPSVPARPPARPPVRIQTVLLSGGAVLLVLASVVFASVTWTRLGAGGQVAVLTVVIGVLTAAAHALRGSYRSTAEAVAAIAGAVTAVALLAAPELGLGADWMRDQPSAWATVAFAVLAALAATMAWLSRLTAWRVTFAAATVAMAFSAALAVGSEPEMEPVGCAGLAVAAAAVLRLWPPRTSGWRCEPPWIAAGLGTLAVLTGFTGYGILHEAAVWAGVWLVVAGCAVSAVIPVRGSAAVSRTSGAGLVLLGVAGAAVGQAVVLVATTEADSVLALPVAALIGSALLATTVAPRFSVPGHAAALTTWLFALALLGAREDAETVLVSAFLAIVAVSLLAVSIVPGRAPVAWAGAVVGSVSAWVLLGDLGADTLEAFTSASAVLLLAAGMLHRRADHALGSLAVLGPALAMAALPSALLAFAQAADGRAPLRAALVILGGTALGILGARFRVRAALLVGLAAALLAGLGQVGALADLVPRWIAMGVAGTLLLVAGFSAERLARAGRQAWQATWRLR
ncbi:MAG: hypothetical protein GXX79_00340 [Actinomycetales bacterium]|nr:hypothetical protein [Actinomycetales bacterium]